MHDSRTTFPERERLKKSEALAQLVRSGRSALSHPVRCTFLPLDYDGESHVKVAFSVSKKTFKSAVKRNKIKRQMREVFRLNKSDLIDALIKLNMTCHILFIFIDKEEPEFKVIEKAMTKLIERMCRD